MAIGSGLEDSVGSAGVGGRVVDVGDVVRVVTDVVVNCVVVTVVAVRVTVGDMLDDVVDIAVVVTIPDAAHCTRQTHMDSVKWYRGEMFTQRDIVLYISIVYIH